MSTTVIIDFGLVTTQLCYVVDNDVKYFNNDSLLHDSFPTTVSIQTDKVDGQINIVNTIIGVEKGHGHVLYGFKSILGLSAVEPQADIFSRGNPYLKKDKDSFYYEVSELKLTVIDVSILFFKQIDHLIKENLLDQPYDVLITIPSYFNSTQRKVLKEAISLAGMQFRCFLHASLASGLAHITSKEFFKKLEDDQDIFSIMSRGFSTVDNPEGGKFVLVNHMGESALDSVLIEVSFLHGQTQLSVKSYLADIELGGKVVYEEMYKKAIEDIDYNEGYYLDGFKDYRLIKENIDIEFKNKVFELLTMMNNSKKRGIFGPHISFPIRYKSISDSNSIKDSIFFMDSSKLYFHSCCDVVKRINKHICMILDDFYVRRHAKPDAVIYDGQMFNIPYFERAIRATYEKYTRSSSDWDQYISDDNYYGKPASFRMHTDSKNILNGATIFVRYLNGFIKNTSIKDTLGYSVGVYCGDGHVCHLISKNNNLPYEISQKFVLKNTEQSKANIKLMAFDVFRDIDKNGDVKLINKISILNNKSESNLNNPHDSIFKSMEIDNLPIKKDNFSFDLVIHVNSDGIVDDQIKNLIIDNESNVEGLLVKEQLDENTVHFNLGDEYLSYKGDHLATHAGIQSGIAGNASIYADNVILGASRGHGFAAEKANHLFDMFNGKDANLVGGNNIKNGADRLVDGSYIQTKYCSSGSKCIAETFENGSFKYMNTDGTPMQIEVPSDMYDSAVQAMQERIRKGQVPNISDPEKATELVRKGNFTYEQAKNIAQFGSIEGLTYDAINGIQVAGSALGLSAAVSFAVSIWSGEDIEAALEKACFTGIKVFGVSWVTGIISSQIARTSIEQGLRGTTDYCVQLMGSKVTSCVTAALRGGDALYGMAAANHLSKLLRGNIVASVIATAVLSTIDFVRMFDGRISGGQFFKNTATTAAGVTGGGFGWGAGAAMGTAVLPGAGTLIGGLIGATIGGFVTSKTTNALLNTIIEDDSVEMLKIVEVVFGEVAFDYLLNEKEAQSAIEGLIQGNFAAYLREVYAAYDKKTFVRNTLIPIIESIVKLRKPIALPTSEQIFKATCDVIEKLVDSQPSSIIPVNPQPIHYRGEEILSPLREVKHPMLGVLS